MRCLINLDDFLKSSTINLEKSTTGFKIGDSALSDCLAADTRIFSKRSCRASLRSERWQRKSVISLAPISVAFSIKNCIRAQHGGSLFLLYFSYSLRCVVFVLIKTENDYLSFTAVP